MVHGDLSRRVGHEGGDKRRSDAQDGERLGLARCNARGRDGWMALSGWGIILEVCPHIAIAEVMV